ncbi:MAG: hypothetical protein GY796_34640 [Chloroflexi bacterium]|nr:hypothetical protein [Chloroflexota bacterium]
MSVVIVVKVSEGLVLAADSAATLSGRVLGPSGVLEEGILQTFYNAKKLLQIGSDLPIGVLTWGQAYIGQRTIESLVREWEYNSGWQSLELFREKNTDETYSVEACAKGLLAHLSNAHQEEFKDMPEEGRPGLGIVVAGYSEQGFFPEIWRFVLPFDKDITNQRPDINGKPDFGANWFGITEPAVRLHFGRDDGVMQIISEKYDIPMEELHEALNPLQYQIPFPQMPLQDAIEYANYMINVVIGRFRFVIGPELCGGQIDIAAITQREFHWLSKKTWKLA